MANSLVNIVDTCNFLLNKWCLYVFFLLIYEIRKLSVTRLLLLFEHVVRVNMIWPNIFVQNIYSNFTSSFVIDHYVFVLYFKIIIFYFIIWKYFIFIHERVDVLIIMLIVYWFFFFRKLNCIVWYSYILRTCIYFIIWKLR